MNKNKLFEEIMRIGGNIVTASFVAIFIQPYNNWFIAGAASGIAILLISFFYARK